MTESNQIYPNKFKKKFLLNNAVFKLLSTIISINHMLSVHYMTDTEKSVPQVLQYSNPYTSKYANNSLLFYVRTLPLPLHHQWNATIKVTHNLHLYGIHIIICLNSKFKNNWITHILIGIKLEKKVESIS